METGRKLAWLQLAWLRLLVRLQAGWDEDFRDDDSPVGLSGEISLNFPDDALHDYALRFEAGRLVAAERFSYEKLAIDARTSYDPGHPPR